MEFRKGAFWALWYLKKVVKVMPTARFRQVANGLFHSKLCLHVFGNVWGLADQDDQNRKCSTFTKSDNQKLQVLQNVHQNFGTSFQDH